MFKFNQLRQLHLEITNNCQASCPMCNRNISGGIENPLIKITNWTLEDFKNIISQEVLYQIENYYFCSNFGDPMMNNDLINMCQWSADNAPNVMVTIHTNGGARTTEWWEALAKSMPSKHMVVFALDGLEDTHHLYRVGTKFQTVLRNAKAFISAGGTAEWVFIKFKHNEHQVEQARFIATDAGFKKFTLKNSSRFILEPQVRVLDKRGVETHTIEPASDTPLKFVDKKIIQAYKKIVEHSNIECKVQQEKEAYIDAHKNLYPCCWLASVPYSYIPSDNSYEVRTEMLNQHHDMMKSLGNTNTIDRSIKDIIDSHAYQTVWNDYWTKNKLITCARTCGVNTDFAKPKDQIVNE